MKDCPKCKLLNPDSAERCDCGYDFASGSMQSSYLSGKDKRENSYGRGLSWPLKALLFILAGLAGLFEHALSGWGGPTAMALAAVLVPVALYRRFWGRRWFWVAIVALAAAQVPLVATARPLILRAGRFSLLTFVVVDGLFVIFVISLVNSMCEGQRI